MFNQLAEHGWHRAGDHVRAFERAESRMRPRMTTIERSTWATKVGLARMLAGGVIMDVVTADQAKVAEEAGAVAVMALERVP